MNMRGPPCLDRKDAAMRARIVCPSNPSGQGAGGVEDRLPMPLDLDLQTTWDPDPLRQPWPQGRHNRAFFSRIAGLPVELTASGTTGRVLEVAASEAVHACGLAELGLECF